MAFQFPDPNVTPEFTGDNGITYSWDATDGKWVIKRYAADFDDRYVNEKGGDTMEGQLVIDGPRKAGDDPDNPDLVSSVKVLNIDNAQNSSLQLRHGGNAKVYIGDTDVAIANDIKVVRAAGSIVKTDDADLINIKGEEVSYTGKIENEKNLVTKKYVDDADEELHQDIIELEEEIDAIAPSVERGFFRSTAYDNIPRDGEFMLRTLGGKTIDYGDENIVVVELSKVDDAGVTHTFADTGQGQLIQLFEEGNEDFGLYQIESITGTDPGTTAVTFTVSFVSGSGEATIGDLARLKIFSPPEGGTASEFVKKIGDTMTGNLGIDKSTGTANAAAALTLKGERSNVNDSAATIKFENAKNSLYPGYLTYKSYGSSSNWFGFNQDVDLSDHGLHSVGRIRMKSGASIGSGTNPRIVIKDGNDTNAGTQIQRPGDNKRTFAIKGKAKGSSTVTDFFWAYGNSGSGGDAINYTGLVSQSNHIVNKNHVDNNFVKGNFTITKSNGNYYIQ